MPISPAWYGFFVGRGGTMFGELRMTIEPEDRAARAAFLFDSGGHDIFDIVGRLDPRNPKVACEQPKAMR